MPISKVSLRMFGNQRHTSRSNETMRALRIVIAFLFIGLIVLGIVKLRAYHPAHAARITVATPPPAEVVSRPIQLPLSAPSRPPLLQTSPPSPPSESNAASADEEEDAMIISSEPAQKSARSEIENETLEAAVSAIVPELNRCYRDALLRDKSLRGDITIEMTVAPQEGIEQGVIEDAAVDAEEFQAPLLEQCLLSAMIALRLPKPASRVYISYPFTLDPGDEDENRAALNTALPATDQPTDHAAPNHAK